MTLSIFLLVLISAFCHAAWNFAARKAAGNLVAIWLGLWLACALIFPGVIGIVVHKGLRETAQVPAIICIIATGLIHSVYFRLLAAGYRHGEISLVYPIARGSGIALTAILARFFLNEDFTFLGSVGIGLISVGIISMSASVHRRVDDTKAVTLALCIGASIVAYSLVDKIGVNHTNPVVYIWSMFLIAAIVLTPSLIRRYRGTLGQEARQCIGYAVLIGAGSIGTYLMILFAFTMGPVGYIVAVREFSVVLGSLAGIIFLKERSTITKMVTICVIVVGIICIKLS
jgi:uncharacterized membrane protein